jgi:hypothetical protein
MSAPRHPLQLAAIPRNLAQIASIVRPQLILRRFAAFHPSFSLPWQASVGWRRSNVNSYQDFDYSPLDRAIEAGKLAVQHEGVFERER